MPECTIAEQLSIAVGNMQDAPTLEDWEAEHAKAVILTALFVGII